MATSKQATHMQLRTKTIVRSVILSFLFIFYSIK